MKPCVQDGECLASVFVETEYIEKIERLKGGQSILINHAQVDKYSNGNVLKVLAETRIVHLSSKKTEETKENIHRIIAVLKEEM